MPQRPNAVPIGDEEVVILAKMIIFFLAGSTGLFLVWRWFGFEASLCAFLLATSLSFEIQWRIKK